MIDPSTSPLVEELYHPEADVENLEEYVPSGFHPTSIVDTFRDGHYHYRIVHKLGFGGYSTICLARDQQLQRYVSLKILVASLSGNSNEANILRLLQNGNSGHPSKQFIQTILDEFKFKGPNGQQLCLVGVLYGCSISKSKEDSANFMFPVDAAWSAAAQLIMGLLYLHANGICQLHVRNFFLRIPSFDSLTTEELYNHYGKPYEARIRRVDGNAPEPHAAPHAIYPMIPSLSANEVSDPETPSPTLHTPALYAPPEGFFQEPVTPAADVWTLGVNLYEVLDDVIGEIVNTLGPLPARWWSSRTNRGEFFEPDGEWVTDFRRKSTPIFHRLRQRLWDMGLMAFEPAEWLTAEQLMESEYVTKWALPAWERQIWRKGQQTIK
ncbi:protein kinase [Bisporella sp. PMI_857]|nr:protein kinase [Bisporella sp. PMI_857]